MSDLSYYLKHKEEVKALNVEIKALKLRVSGLERSNDKHKADKKELKLRLKK